MADLLYCRVIEQEIEEENSQWRRVFSIRSSLSDRTYGEVCLHRVSGEYRAFRNQDFEGNIETWHSQEYPDFLAALDYIMETA